MTAARIFLLMNLLMVNLEGDSSTWCVEAELGVGRIGGWLVGSLVLADAGR